MGIIWTIVIGFIAGVIAKFLTPGKTSRPGPFSQRSWGSSAPSLPLISVRLWAGMGRMKARVLLGQSLER